MRRRAVAESIIHGGEFRLHILFAEADQAEGLHHDLRIMIPDCTGAELHAVADQVILESRHGQRIHFPVLRLPQNLQTSVGHGEGIMAEFELAAFLPDLIHREINDPAELIFLPVHMIRAQGAQLLHKHAGGFLGRGEFAGAETDQRVLRQIQLRNHPVLPVLQEFGNAAHDFALLVHPEPVDLVPSDNLYIGTKLVDLLPGAGEIRHLHGLHPLPFKGAEAAAAQERRRVLHRQVNPQIRLVAAVKLHGFQIRNAPEGSGRRGMIRAVFREDRRKHLLQHGEHVILGGEGHLHVQLIELAGRTVAPGILVPETGGNLEIPVKAGGHQQLLKLLGRLGQCIEFSRVLPGGNQIIPGSLRGGSREDRRRDLQEALADHGAPKGGHHLGPEDDPVLHLRVPQIQIPVFQADAFIRLLAAVDLERQRVIPALPEHLQAVRHHFDVSGIHLWILAGPLPDDAGHRDHAFLVQGRDLGQQGGILHHQLGRAVKVPEHHEGQATAHLPHILHPPGEAHFLSRVRQAEFITGMSSGLHD